MNWMFWQEKFETFLHTQMMHDSAHDMAHIRRVVHNARRLAQEEEAQLEVVLPAAWLHDCVVIPKNSSQRSNASRIAADTAVTFLRQQMYPSQYLDGIAQAIAAHSFSARIRPITIEAQVVQDADRIDAIGAIGIARCFAVGGMLARPLYDETDPFCDHHLPDDNKATLDHFYTKLLTLADTMQTNAGRREAHGRTQFMLNYLTQLRQEIIL
ncbi:MAG TPA: HD domain-containing protein [Chloroflexota bacterium]|nr:HD domain-containing protein [Chloroflexota bacterium]HUM67862.1 HD domain-containing protein [Chloroflexota bacterium]